MKFKYPKSILIGGTEFKIKYDKNGYGGDFSYPHNGKKAFIRIGIKNDKCRKYRILDIFIHEVKEIIQYEQGVRMEGTTVSENYKFFYEHKEHSDLCSRLTGCLKQFIV